MGSLTLQAPPPHTGTVGDNERCHTDADNAGTGPNPPPTADADVDVPAVAPRRAPIRPTNADFGTADPASEVVRGGSRRGEAMRGNRREGPEEDSRPKTINDHVG